MIRSRTCLLTLTAALLVAGPVLAYSFPVLFGLPAVFGQEPPRAKKSTCPKVTVIEDSDSEYKDLIVNVKEAHPGSLMFGAGLKADMGILGSVRLPIIMPYADEKTPQCAAARSCDTLCCEEMGDSLAAWRKLWREGKFREAFSVAKWLMKAVPDSVDVRHAYVVSQLVNQTSIPSILPFPLTDVRGILTAGAFSVDLGAPVPASLKIDCECTMSECPLVGFLSSLFGGAKETKAAACGSCPLTANVRTCGMPNDCCQDQAHERNIVRCLDRLFSCNWKDVPFRQVLEDLRTMTGVNIVPDMPALRAESVDLNAPVTLKVEHVRLKSILNMLLQDAKLDYVVNNGALEITTVPTMRARCVQAEALNDRCEIQTVRGPQGPMIIWILRQPVTDANLQAALPPPQFGPMPAPQFLQMPPQFPPPFLAPPPPPLVQQGEGAYIPVPVPPFPAQPQRIQNILFDPAAEPCEPAAPALANVRIVQTKVGVQLTTPNYEARCDRIEGAANGAYLLEGNVKLTSRRHGQTMTIHAKRVILNVKEDRFVVDGAQGLEQSRVNVAPVGYTADPHDRMQEMLNESENLRQIRAEWHQFWSPEQPSKLTPIRVHGGVGP